MPNRNPNRIARRDERAHPIVEDAIKRGYATSGDDYLVTGLASHDIANQARLTINRALEHFGLARASRVIDDAGNACWKDCQDPDALHGVSFRLLAKNSARNHIARQSGGDPSKLKYNPYQQVRTGRFSEDGTWIPGTPALPERSRSGVCAGKQASKSKWNDVVGNVAQL